MYVSSIDLSTIHRLFNNDPSRMREWVALYLSETPAYFNSIQQGYFENDAEQIASAVHDLQPMAHYLCCQELKQLLYLIKTQIEEPDFGERKEVCELLMQLEDKIAVELRKGMYAM